MLLKTPRLPPIKNKKGNLHKNSREQLLDNFKDLEGEVWCPNKTSNKKLTMEVYVTYHDKQALVTLDGPLWAALTAQLQSKFGMFQFQAWIQQQGLTEELTDQNCQALLQPFAFVHVFQCNLPQGKPTLLPFYSHLSFPNRWK